MFYSPILEIGQHSRRCRRSLQPEPGKQVRLLIRHSMTVHTATFAGTRYDIHITGPIDGLCDQPSGGKPSIHLIVPLDTQKGLETAIHEFLHASRWHAKEETVTRTARDVARLLWRLGYRLTEP